MLKKYISFIAVFAIIIFIFPVTATAEQYDYGTTELYDAVPEEAKDFLNENRISADGNGITPSSAQALFAYGGGRANDRAAVRAVSARKGAAARGAGGRLRLSLMSATPLRAMFSSAPLGAGGRGERRGSPRPPAPPHPLIGRGHPGPRERVLLRIVR